MKIVENTNLILNKECEKFDFTKPPFDPIEFSRDLVKTMYDSNAITLTANQVGEPYRIFAMRGSPENFVCYNPRIVVQSEELVVLEESCIMYPKLLVKIKRPQHVKVRFQLPNGETVTETFTGLTARTFQHSLDYLNGVRYYNRANKYHKDIAFKKWKQ